MRRQNAYAVACCAIAFTLPIGCGPKQNPATGQQGTPPPTQEVKAAPTTTAEAKKVYTREEFKSLVMGKTADGVLKAVGKPDSTLEFGDEPSWYYKRVTTDPVSGKVDYSAQLIFAGGVVVGVNY
jgi:hypothetical protein